MRFIRSLFVTALFTAVSAGAAFAQGVGSIGGQVVDTLGAVVVGATVTAVAPNGTQKQAIANSRGEFAITGLAPGKYTVKAIAPKFALYENTEVIVTAGERNELTVLLTVAAIDESVNVKTGDDISTDPNANKDATVLTEKELEALPDDPDELQAALQALAGSMAGPDGGQIMIDGFTGGRMPPKEAIREIRINQNPFSAEFDRVGFGRIDVLTRPGFDKFRGGANFNFNDEALNSRNPFSINRAASQTRNFGGHLSGPISSKRASFFFDINSSSRDENAVISAIILDPNTNIDNFNEEVKVPTRRLSFSPRIDYAINDKNTLQGRYNFNRNTSENQGIGGYSLPSRATESSSTNQGIQVTESMIINAKTVNETRFQFDVNNRETEGDSSIPTVNVSQSFVGGGSSTGLNYNKTKRWELQNYTTTSFGAVSQHSVKFGVRVRGVNVEDRSENNYGGTFVFSGLTEVRIPAGCDPNNPPPPPGSCQVIPAVSSINQYRQKVLGNPDPRFNPTQFSITTGNPVASVSQVDYGPFFTDDWKIRQDLMLSFGLRYENQTNISSNMNFAPRFGFAYSPGAGGARAPKTVFRGGIGVFYDRFGEGQTLRATRNDGVSQIQYTVTNNPAILGLAVFNADGTVSNVPTAALIGAAVPRTSIPFRIDDELTSPYSVQGALSVEHQITPTTVLSATFTSSKTMHTLRTRNINAAVCPDTIVCPPGLIEAQIAPHRPDPTQGNIYRIESSGYAKANMFRVNFRTNFRSRVTLFGGYTLAFANGDTDSLSSPNIQINAIGYPAYNYDLSGEYAPSAFTPRHMFNVAGSITLPWGIRANPNVTIVAGRPFNITSGTDSNYDSLFFERPTFALLNERCQFLRLTNDFCDMSGVSDMNAIIPRNYGKGPGSFQTNLNLSKTFGFGGRGDSVAANGSNQRGGGNAGGGGASRGPGGGGGGGGPQMVMMGGGGMMGGGAEARRPYQLTVGVNIQNLFNTVNLSNPVSQVTSPTFGISRSTGGGFGGFGGGGGSANRRIDLSLRFNF